MPNNAELKTIMQTIIITQSGSKSEAKFSVKGSKLLLKIPLD